MNSNIILDSKPTSRRDFLGGMTRLVPLTLIFAAPIKRSDQNLKSPYYLQSCWIAGARYYEASHFIGRIRAGDSVMLRAEPDNPHDEFAIEILWQGHKLGYIPRQNNTVLRHLLRQHATVTGNVMETGGRPESPTIRVAIYMPQGSESTGAGHRQDNTTVIAAR
jgi:hypothetical protein